MGTEVTRNGQRQTYTPLQTLVKSAFSTLAG